MHELWERVSEGRELVDLALVASLCGQAERSSALRTELLLYVQRKLFAEDEQSCEAGEPRGRRGEEARCELTHSSLLRRRHGCPAP